MHYWAAASPAIHTLRNQPQDHVVHWMRTMGLFSKTRNYPDPRKNSACTELEVDNWVISQFILEKVIPAVGVQPFPLNELLLMCAATCHARPALIFDWGTHVGKSARVFRETVKAFDISCHIHSIDLPDDVAHVEHPSNERGRLVKGMPEVTLHQGDGVSTALQIMRAQKNAVKCLFYVDGDHAYESVERELTMILEHAPDAHILLHDTFYQSAASGYNVGPYQAIEKVMAGRMDRYQVIHTRTGLPGMTLIHPK